VGEYASAEGDLCTIPDNLTLTQFILDSTHWRPTRPMRKERIPWFIDDTTGRQIGFEEVSREMTNDDLVGASESPQVRMLSY